MVGETAKEPVIIYRRVGSEDFFGGGGGVWSLDVK